MFGAYDTIPFQPGEWQVSFNYRGLRSDDHYNGTRFQYQRETLRNYVLNTQEIFDLGATWSLTRRLHLAGSIPVVNATWSIPMPITPPGIRREQNAAGIGDLSVMGRTWLLDPESHRRGNVSVGLGIKAPTGDHEAKDEYPDRTGANNAVKAVDQSIQPGDGGWGVIFDFQGYKRLRPVTFYGSGTYLANPRDTNGTPSIIVGLGLGSDPRFADLLVNSVPDQYVARAGALFPFGGDRFSVSLGLRIEGVPRYDLFGGSHGWRRPGYETFLEPGFTYTRGQSTWSLHVPRGLLRNRQPNPYTGTPGDATFPDYIVLFGYSYRFQPRAADRVVPAVPGTAEPGPVEPPPVTSAADAAPTCDTL